MEMEWTQEAIRAEIDRRHESAQHYALVRQVRESQQSSRPSWWRRLRSHPGPDDERNEDEPPARAADSRGQAGGLPEESALRRGRRRPATQGSTLRPRFESDAAA